MIEGAFELLGSLRQLQQARVSELVRDSGLPRTTVHRLLGQLEQVGAVERLGSVWRLGVKLVELGSDVPAEPRLRAVSRRPLIDLVNTTGAHVGLSVGMAGGGVIVDFLPGVRRIPLEPLPVGTRLEVPEWASSRAQARARAGDLRMVIDAGGTDPALSCAAAPLRLSRRDVAAVWVITPGRTGITAETIAATRHTARSIASQLSQPRTDARNTLPRAA